MATFDYFVGPLRCSICENISSDSSANMQTKLLKYPSLKQLAVGDLIDADWSEVCAAGYLKIADPDRLDTVTILETWECPKCGEPFNWAKISIAEGKIVSIDSIELTAEIIRTANYITEECIYTLVSPTSTISAIDELIRQLEVA